MRFLHLTDTHATAKNPSSREDVYFVAVLKKFMEIGEIIKQYQVDAVIHTGDVFHTPRVSLKTVNRLAEIIQSWDVPVYVVPGNHDIDGYTIETLDQTVLGTLGSTSVVELVTRDNPIEIEVDGKNRSYVIRIEGQEYYADIDTGKNDDYRFEGQADFKILAAHSMLMERPYFPEIPHTLIKDVQSEADMILTGHYHPGFKETKVNGTYFFNPGSLLRVDIEKRDPRCLLFDIGEDSSEQLVLTRFAYQPLKGASPSTSVFDFTKHQTKKQNKINLANFRSSIQQAVQLQHHQTIEQMIQSVAGQLQLEQSVIDLALDSMSQTKASEVELNKELKGFLEKSQNIYFSKVEINGFQSHEQTIIEFDETGLNVLVGETNSGKSAVLRAILWCLYNDPKGTDFIMTGKTSVSVKITFSDGSSIERKRTKTSAGQYIVTDAAGTSTTYKGFSNDIPAEVANEHQMPEIKLTKDLKTKLNVSSQLEGPFLVGESNLSKANIIGRIVGTQAVDEAIKELNRGILSNNRALKEEQRRIDNWQKQLIAYKDLESQRRHIEEVELVIEAKEKLEQELEQLHELNAKFTVNRKRTEEALSKLNALPDVTKQLLVIERCEVEAQRIIETGQIYRQLERTESDRLKITAQLGQPIYESIERVEQMIGRARELVDNIYDIEQRLSELQSVSLRQDEVTQRLSEVPVNTSAPIEASESIVQQVSELMTFLNELTELQERISAKNVALAKTQQQEHEQQELQQTLTDQLAKQLEDMHECPFCGSTLEEHSINHIIRSEHDGTIIKDV